MRRTSHYTRPAVSTFESRAGAAPLGGGAIALRRPSYPALSAGVLLTAALVGVALAADVRLGVALVLGLIYLPIAMSSLQLALILWFPLVFLEGQPAINLAAKAGGLLLVGIWVVSLRERRHHVLSILRGTPAVWISIVGLLVWYSFSLLWAADRGMVFADLWHWYAVTLLMLIAATTVSSERAAWLLTAAFVAGATAAVAEGIVSGGLTTATTAANTATGGRLEGGVDDPNFLAAGVVSAIVLALVLRSTTLSFAGRWVLLGAVFLLSLGLFASQSRGGIIAAIAAALAALVVFKHRRAWVLAGMAVIAGVASMWFAVSPSAWERVTEFDNGGSGRGDLWAVAWRMAEDKPLHGVGLNNYPAVGRNYVSQPGNLERSELVVDKAQVAHNAYLQALAETGVIGLVLFLVVPIGSLYAAWRAARIYGARGDPGMEFLARGVIVATTGLLAASFFISSGVDKRLWVLFGLGPALLGVARLAQRDPAGPH